MKSEEFSEEDKEFYDKSYTSLGELDSLIEKMENSIPDKRTKDYSSWVDKINFLIEKYNNNMKFKAYKKYE
jgi:hypothetical protein